MIYQLFIKSFLLILCLLSSHMHLSQIQPRGSGNIPGSNILEDIVKRSKNQPITYNDVEGSVYLNTTFEIAQIETVENKKLGSLKARYNAYSDEIEIQNKDGTNGAFIKSGFMRIALNNEIYVVLSYFNDEERIKKEGFFIEKISDPECGLYVRHSKTIKQGEKAKSGYHKATNSKFIDQTDYYLKFGSLQPTPINLKKKQILKSFPKHLKNLEKYSSEQKLSLKTESDLITLINYYNNID